MPRELQVSGKVNSGEFFAPSNDAAAHCPTRSDKSADPTRNLLMQAAAAFLVLGQLPGNANGAPVGSHAGLNSKLADGPEKLVQQGQRREDGQQPNDGGGDYTPNVSVTSGGAAAVPFGELANDIATTQTGQALTIPPNLGGAFGSGVPAKAPTGHIDTAQDGSYGRAQTPTASVQVSLSNEADPLDQWFDQTLEYFWASSELTPEALGLPEVFNTSNGRAEPSAILAPDAMGVTVIGGAMAEGDDTVASGLLNGIAVKRGGISIATGTGMFKAIADSDDGRPVSADATIDAQFTDADVVLLHNVDVELSGANGSSYDSAYVHFLALDWAGYTPINGPIVLHVGTGLFANQPGPDLQNIDLAHGLATGAAFGANTLVDTDTFTLTEQDRFSSVSAQLTLGVG